MADNLQYAEITQPIGGEEGSLFILNLILFIRKHFSY